MLPLICTPLPPGSPVGLITALCPHCTVSVSVGSLITAGIFHGDIGAWLTTPAGL